MSLPANRRSRSRSDLAAPEDSRRWWSRVRPKVVATGPADSAEMELGYESAQPWLLTADAAEPPLQADPPR